MKFGFFLRRKINYLHQKAREFSYLLEYLSWFFFSPNKFCKKPKNVKNVLIVNSGALGDILCSLRIAYLLKKYNKDKNFYMFIPQQYVKQLKFSEKITNVKIILEKDIKKYYFDFVLFFSLPKTLKKYIKHFKFCVGNEYSSVEESLHNLNSLFLNKKVFPKYLHKLKQEIRIARVAGLNFKGFQKNRLILKDRKVEKILRKNKVKQFVIIHPSGRNFSLLFNQDKMPAFSWPLQRFSQVADYIIEKYNLPVLITGTKEESFIAEKIISMCKNKNKIFNFCGKLNVEELTSLVSLAKLVVSIDTFTIHIAEFTNTPVIALFGPSFPEINGVYGNPKIQINLFHPETCVKCRRKWECPEGNNICMKLITIEEVKNAVDKLLNKSINKK